MSDLEFPGAQLRVVRKALGHSLHDVERMSKRGIKASVLGAYERNERQINVVRAAQLAKIYGVTLQTLLFGKVIPTHIVTEAAA